MSVAFHLQSLFLSLDSHLNRKAFRECKQTKVEENVPLCYEDCNRMWCVCVTVYVYVCFR